MFLRSNNKNPISDEQLISSYRNSHNKVYVGELFQRYTHLVFAVCMKYLKNEADSKDAVMDIFEKVMEDLKRHDVQNFKGWLHTVTRNHCLMDLRKDQTEKKQFDGYKNSEEVRMEIPVILHHDNDEDKEKDLKRLEEGIKSLNKEQRRCIELFYIESKSYNDVVSITGYDIKKVKSYIQNGKRNLKLFLTDKNE